MTKLTPYSVGAAFVLSLTMAQSVDRGSPVQIFFDAARNRVVLLTSMPGSQEQALWERQQNTWTRIDAQGPSQRELGSAAYDSRRKRLVVYGGMAPGGNRLDDTWEWDGRQWHAISDRAPGPRSHHMMAFDERRGVVVMFGGGKSDSGLETDTWEWNGSAWRRVATSGPGTRAHFAMAYDAAAGRTIVHGGFDDRYKYHTDTWAWDGRSWARIASEGPPARSHHAIAFDPASRSIMLFGGLKNGNVREPLDDTWSLTADRWRQLQTTGPEARSAHVIGHDPASGGVFLFGGGSWDGNISKKFDELWSFSTASWRRLP